MTIKEALLQCLTEKALGLTKPEVEKILHDELEKPESEVDCDVIDMCIELESGSLGSGYFCVYCFGDSPCLGTGIPF